MGLDKGENEISPKAMDTTRLEAGTWQGPGFIFVAKNAEGYPEYRHEQTGVIFVLLPGEKFQMGSPEEEADRDRDEGPLHEVTLRAFLIAKHEVTQAVWEEVMGSNPSHFKQGKDYPVEQVSWEECQAFCRKTGLKLPSEAQWEYACRGGTSGPYAGTGKLDDMGWISRKGDSKTHAVGGKKPNGFGLYDMHGNVCEWCEDVYDAGYYAKAEARGPDPVSSAGSEDRVFRDGGWYGGTGYCRSASRLSAEPVRRYNYLGFRPAFPLPHAHSHEPNSMVR